jgi:hypothetical protein
MKKLFLILALAGCAATPKKSEHFDNASMFINGCLKSEIAAGYIDDEKCFDANSDGCITLREWNKVMDYWSDHTPRPGQSLCDRK